MRSGTNSRLRWAAGFVQSQKDYLVQGKAQVEGNAVRSIFVQAGIKGELMLKAIYHCIECWSERVYGNSAPDCITGAVWLGCKRCGKPTQHRYSRCVVETGGVNPLSEVVEGPRTINGDHEKGKLIGEAFAMESNPREFRSHGEKLKIRKGKAVTT